MIILVMEAGTADDISTLYDIRLVVSIGHGNPNLKETEKAISFWGVVLYPSF